MVVHGCPQVSTRVSTDCHKCPQVSKKGPKRAIRELNKRSKWLYPWKKQALGNGLKNGPKILLTSTGPVAKTAKASGRVQMTSP